MPRSVSEKFHNELLQQLDDDVFEADSLRQSHVETWRRNYRRYNGDQWDKSPPKGRSQFTFNYIQNAVLGITAVQTESRPAVTFRGRESNESGSAYLTSRGARLLDQLAAAGEQVPRFSRDQLGGIEPIDESFAETLLQLDDRSAFVVNDSSTAQKISVLFDTMWDRSDSDGWLEENILNTNVLGWQPSLIQWDDRKSTWSLLNLHPENVWIDPFSTQTRPANYAVVVELVDANEALQRFPEHADVIESNKSESVDVLSFGGGAKLRTNFSARDSRNQHRKYVALTTAWTRDAEIEIDPETAIEMGLVQVQREPVQLEGAEGLSFQELYVRADNGELTEPGMDNWPDRMIVPLRETRWIGRDCIESGQASYRDMPVFWNVNVPLPHQPYGQGEPERLEDAQKYMNNMSSITHDILKAHAYRLTYMPQSVKNAMKDGERSPSPGSIVTGPDDLYMQMQGRLLTVQDQATPPGQMMQAWLSLPSQMDKISGNVDVLQGLSPGSDASGRAINQLQLAARGPITLKARATERMLKRMARVSVGMIVDFVSPEEASRILTDVPPGAINEMMERASEIEYDIEVAIMAGRGTNKQIQQQLALNLRQLGSIDNETLLKKLEYDDAREIASKVMGEQAAAMGLQVQGAIAQNQASAQAAQNDEAG